MATRHCKHVVLSIPRQSNNVLLIPLGSLAVYVCSQEHQRLRGALYALRLITRKYEFRDAEDRVPLDTVVKTTFPSLLQVFQVSDPAITLGLHACTLGR